MDIVSGAAAELISHGIFDTFAHRRWRDPAPGSSVVVVTLAADWAPMRTTAQAPTIRVLIYAAPTQGQDDAEPIALAAGDRVRTVLHRPQGRSADLGRHPGAQLPPRRVRP